MRSSLCITFALASLGILSACAAKDDGNSGGTTNFVPTGGTPGSTAGTTSGSSGSTSSAGTSAGGASAGGSSAGGASAGGASAGGASAGGASAGGAGGAAGGAGGAAGGEGGAGGAAGGAGGASAGDITSVWPSSACGVATPPDDGTFDIDVSGTKTDCAYEPGCQNDMLVWNDTREYTIYKPAGYVNTNPYRLVFLGPGCGGGSTAIYNYDNSDEIIRVGVRPSQNGAIQGSHGTNQNQGCFDDKEGDDSVDFVLYEALYDLLETQLCFDRNRVFFGGNSSGAWWSNEHGCHYAGDATRPVRGIMPNTGGLPDQDAYRPTCTENGMAGMWIHETGDGTNPFSGNIYAINRAMGVNGCVAGQTYDTAEFEMGYPIGECRRILGCNELFPLVVCPLNGNGHGGHEDTVNPGVAAFLDSFLEPPLAAAP